MGNGCDERISYFQLLSQEGETTNWYDIQRNMYFCLLGGGNAPPQLSNRNNQISNLFVVSLSLQPSLVYLHHTLAMNIIEYLSIYTYIESLSRRGMAPIHLSPHHCRHWPRYTWSLSDTHFLSPNARNGCVDRNSVPFFWLWMCYILQHRPNKKNDGNNILSKA